MGLGIKMGGGGGSAATYAWMKTLMVNGVKDDSTAKYITSENPNAYPEYGVNGNYFYEKVPLRVTNGSISRCYSASGTIAPNTFVQFVTGTPSLGPAYSVTENALVYCAENVSDNSVVEIDYRSGGLGTTVYTIGEDKAITRGTRAAFASNSSVDVMNVQPRVLKLSGEQFVLCYSDTNEKLYLAPFKVSGTTITIGSYKQISTVGTAHGVNIFKRSDGTCIAIFNQARTLYYCTFTVSNNAVTVTKTETSIGSGQYVSNVAQLTDDKYVILQEYELTTTSTNYYLNVFDYSTKTLGSTLNFGGGSDNTIECDIVGYDDSRFVVTYLDSTNTKSAYVAVGTVSGNTATIGEKFATSAFPADSDYSFCLNVAKLKYSYVAVSYVVKSSYVATIDLYKIADNKLELVSTLSPFGTTKISYYGLSKPVTAGNNALFFASKEASITASIDGASTEAVVIDYGVKAVPATTVIEGITRTKVYESVTGEVWTLNNGQNA